MGNDEKKDAIIKTLVSEITDNAAYPEDYLRSAAALMTKEEQKKYGVIREKTPDQLKWADMLDHGYCEPLCCHCDSCEAIGMSCYCTKYSAECFPESRDCGSGHSDTIKRLMYHETEVVTLFIDDIMEPDPAGVAEHAYDYIDSVKDIIDTAKASGIYNRNLWKFRSSHR